MSQINKFIITLIFKNQINLNIFNQFKSILQQFTTPVHNENQLSDRVIELRFQYELKQDQYLELNQTCFNFSNENSDVNCILQLDNVFRRYKNLFVFDMDSTLINEEVIDIMAELAGCQDQVKLITERAMNGELNFKSSLVERVALLKGLSTDIFDQVRQRITFTKGVKQLCQVLKSLGIKMAVISGGFLPLAEYVKNELGLDHFFANELEVDPNTNTLTGRVINDIITPERKAQLVQELTSRYSTKFEKVAVVGDGANDIPMLTLAGLGVAFNAKPKVQQEVSVRLNQPYISDILFLLGLSQEEIDQLIS